MQRKLCSIILAFLIVTLFSIPAWAYDDPPQDTGHVQSGTRLPPQPTPPDPPSEDPCKNKNKPGSASKGSPVYVASGDLVLTFVDVIIPGPGPSMDVVRTYNSQEHYNGPFGYGWVSEHTMQLVQYTDGIDDFALIRLTDGRRATFIKNPDGTYTGLDVLTYDRLQENGDGTFTLNANCGSCARSSLPEIGFNANGYPIYIADLQGEQLSFTYDGNGFLKTVTNAGERTLTYGYGQNLKISSITLPNGDAYAYGYDEDENLTSVSDPAGNTTFYVYNTEHQLISVIDPTGRTLFEATYDDLGRVATYSEGGETYTYTYDTTNKKTTKKDSKNNSWIYYYTDDDIIWKTTFPDGATVEIQFDENNNPTQMVDANGHIWTYTYDPDGNLLSKTDPLGNTWTYTYNDFGQLTEEGNPLGYTKTFTYDENGNSVSRTDEAGNQWTFTYDTRNQITAMTDPLGRTTSFEYDAFGNMVTRTDALGNATTFTYDTLGRLRSETDPLGNPKYYSFNDAGFLTLIRNALGNNTFFEHDPSGNKIEETDALGNRTRYVYDSQNRLIKIMDPLGGETTFAYNTKGQKISETDPLGNTKIWDYDARGRMISEKDALDHATTYTYDGVGNRLTKTDARGHTTTFTYNEINQNNGVTDALGNQYQYEYDGLGRLLAATDPLGYSVTKTYDPLGRVLTRTDETGNTVTSVFDAVGNLLSRTNAAGETTTFTYDALNRRSSMTGPGGEVRQWSYDEAGNLVHETFPHGEVVTYSYDPLNRRVKAEDGLGILTVLSYDALGRRITEADGAGNMHQYGYDALGRQTSTIFADASEQNIEYDAAGNMLRMVDPMGADVTFVYDKLKRIVSSTDSAGTTSATYDEVGNRLTVTDAKGNTFSYEYDALNRMTKETYPNNSMKRFMYDPKGRKTKDILPSGEEITYEYNPAGRMVKRTLSVGQEATFTYDAVGRMLTASNPAGTFTNTYYPDGRLMEEKQPYGTVQYGYDLANGVRTLTYPNGRIINETYDIRERLLKVSEGANDLLTYGYDDANNQINTATFQNGVVSNFAYNPTLKVTEIGHKKDANWLFHQNLNYDVNGMITDEEDLLDSSKSRHYTYDPIQRLTEVDNGDPVADTTTYDLDPLGNWLSVSATGGGAGYTNTVNNLNQYTDSAGTALNYALNGDLTEDDSFIYEYNALGQLITVKELGTSNTVATYEYDAIGRRVKKLVGSTTTTCVYEGGGHVIEEYVDGILRAAYVYGSNPNEVLSVRVSGNDYFYHHDIRRSPVMVTDSGGDIVERYAYDVYGKVKRLDSQGNEIGTSQIENPFYFTGHPLDVETGLYFARVRYYSPELGRFLNRDPSGFADGLNLYEYAQSNPINFVDPFGKDCTEIRTISWDAGQKVNALLHKTVVLRGLDFSLTGGISFKEEDCKDRCCKHKTGQFVNGRWTKYTLEGFVQLEYVGIIPSLGVDFGVGKIGLMGVLGLKFSAGGYLSKAFDSDCNLQFFGAACVALSGTIGLRFGLDAGEQSSYVGVKAYIEGAITPSGMLCYTSNGWDGNLCIGGHIKAVGEVRFIWYSAGTTADIVSGKWCIGNENL